MSVCKNNSTGAPKAKHLSSSRARSELKRIQKKTNHLVQTYKCSKCGYFHNGRVPILLSYDKERRRRRAVEDYLIGKLIVALRAVIEQNGRSKYER